MHSASVDIHVPTEALPFYPIQVPSRFRGWVSLRATSSDLGPTLRRCWLVAPDESWCCPSSSFFSSLCLFCLQLCPQESPFAGCHVSLHGHKISPFALLPLKINNPANQRCGCRLTSQLRRGFLPNAWLVNLRALKYEYSRTNFAFKHVSSVKSILRH